MSLPSTIAKVFVAFRSFFAELFSLFFLLALLALYIVNLEPEDAFFRSFLDEEVPVRMLGDLPSWKGRRDPELLNLFNSCLFVLFPFRFACELELAVPRGGGEDEVEEDGPEVPLGLGLGLEFISIASCNNVLLAAPS